MNRNKKAIIVNSTQLGEIVQQFLWENTISSLNIQLVQFINRQIGKSYMYKFAHIIKSLFASLLNFPLPKQLEFQGFLVLMIFQTRPY